MEKVKLERERDSHSPELRSTKQLLDWDQKRDREIRDEIRREFSVRWMVCVCVFLYFMLDRDEMSLVPSDLIVIGQLCGSQQLEFFYKLNLFLITWKLTKLVFSFHCYNSIFWVMRYKNWKQKWNQTREPEVGPTKFENWVMKMAKPNTPLLSSVRA